MTNMDLIYWFLGCVVVGFAVVLVVIGPVLAEFWGLCLLPIGSVIQWVAFRLQETARRLWMAGRRLENDGKLYRRSA